MNRIKSFVDSLFEGTRMTKALIEQKEELILNMTDRFNELLSKGKNDEDAYIEVINNFGSIEEIKSELNIPIKHEKKKNRLIKWIVSLIVIAILGYWILLIAANPLIW
jgi:hypothetical protein